MKPRLGINDWPCLDVWMLRFRGVWFDFSMIDAIWCCWALSWFPMGALKTLVVDLPWMAELFGLNVPFALVLLAFDVDHFLRFAGVRLFFMWWLTLSRFPMKPHADVNEWPSLDVWAFKSLLNRWIWKTSVEIVLLLTQVFGVCVLRSSNRSRRNGLLYDLKMLGSWLKWKLLLY